MINNNKSKIPIGYQYVLTFEIIKELNIQRDFHSKDLVRTIEYSALLINEEQIFDSCLINYLRPIIIDVVKSVRPVSPKLFREDEILTEQIRKFLREYDIDIKEEAKSI